MVYTGKPSRGCQTCKSRRIRCDEGRPTCQKCQKSGRSCPGFPDEFDLMFRNENAAVVRRVRRQASKTRSSPTATSSRPSSESPKDGDDEKRILPPAQRSSAPRTDSFNVADQSPSKNTQRPQKLTFTSTIKTPIETQATSFFFQNFVIPPRQSKTVDTFLNCLVPYYNSANMSSALHLATNAVSLSAFGKDPSRGATAQEAGRAYGKALRKVGEALQDPASAATDETILSILLFALYESIMSTNDSITAWKHHISGAVTLTKLRGADGFSTEHSRQIFHAVRAMMLSTSIQKCIAIEDFSSSNHWHIEDENPPNRLTLMSMGVANIRAELKKVLDMPDGVQKVTEARKLLESAIKVDNSLQTWWDWLPDKWQPRTVSMVYELDPDVQQAARWLGPVHVYPDIYAAHVLNDYRICRITTQTVVLAACSAISPDLSDEEAAAMTRRARYITQTLVDDVCASVPFHLDYSVQQQADVGPQDRQAAEALGGYLLVWHIFVCANLETLSPLQRSWLQGRLSYVGRVGVIQAQVLSMVRRREDANKFDSPGPAGPIPGPLTLSTATEALSGMTLDAGIQSLNYDELAQRAAGQVGHGTRLPATVQSK
ncbi:uncharacterized protein J3D65DRAFT_633947 [Phyllosticta citribraziliensis]|uniref:Zn(2)-C6 fungal-type domain-containing protein n=1 Tax=Phyllosticta citribraziliensis TaxID=989973 RepID=A0ABR1LCK5_9PEZI